MNTIETTIQDGRIEIDAPGDLPDGTKVLVGITPVPAKGIGIADVDWRDDAEALADWKAWLATIEPIEWPTAGGFANALKA